MKKKLFSMLMLTTLFALPVFVNAEEVKQPSDFNDEQSVVVGNVDTTVYSVDIEWGSFSYDWKYNSETNKFEFRAPLGCHPHDGNATMIANLQSDMERGVKIYSDSTCSTEVTGTLTEGTTYYKNIRVDGRVRVIDNSVNGRIKAKASFTPSGTYANWVIGKFYGDTTNFDEVTGKADYTNELTDNYLVRKFDGFTNNSLYGWLKLDVDNEYTGEKTVETGTTLGTVTLEISEDTD